MTIDPNDEPHFSETRRRPYASVQKKITVISVVVLGLAAIGGLAYRFASQPTTVTEKLHRTTSRNDNGEQYHPPVERIAARPPQPQHQPPHDQPKTGNQRQPPPTIATGVADPQLTAPITTANQNTGVQGFLKAKIETPAPQGRSRSDDSDELGTGEDNALSRSLVKSNIGPKSKAYVDNNYFYKIYPGTVIPLVRRTAINSQLPGYVMAVIRDDVKNDDGFTLIPKDSKVFGQIKDSVIFGNDRVPILWTQIRTTDRPVVVIPISNPGADMLGRPGATGEVNNHVPEMLLATLTYTLIEAIPNAAIAALQNLNQSNNNSPNVNYNQFVNPGQSLGGRVLEKYMNIKPTLEAPPGVTELMVVGTEIDTSAAIEARYANPQMRVAR